MNSKPSILHGLPRHIQTAAAVKAGELVKQSMSATVRTGVRTGALTPLDAVEHVSSLRHLVTAFPEEMVQKAMWRCSLHEMRERWLVRFLRTVLGNIDIVIWKPDMWGAAVRGHGDAFETEVFQESDIPPTMQIWQWEGKTGPASPAFFPEMFDLDVPCGCVSWIVLRSTVIMGWHTRPSEAIIRASLDANWMPEGSATGNSQDGLVMCAVFSPLEVQPGGIVPNLPRLRFFPMISIGDEIGPYSRLMAGLRLMNLPLVESEEVRLPRPTRRRMEKTKQVVPTIRTIILRRPKQRAKTEVEEAKHIDWQCRWIVDGYWRKGHMRGDKRIAPHYVSSHAKGPEGKPLKPPRQNVFVVKREKKEA